MPTKYQSQSARGSEYFERVVGVEQPGGNLAHLVPKVPGLEHRAADVVLQAIYHRPEHPMPVRRRGAGGHERQTKHDALAQVPGAHRGE